MDLVKKMTSDKGRDPKIDKVGHGLADLVVYVEPEETKTREGFSKEIKTHNDPSKKVLHSSLLISLGRLLYVLWGRQLKQTK